MGMPRENLDGMLVKTASCNFFLDVLLVCECTTLPIEVKNPGGFGLILQNVSHYIILK